MGRDHDQIPDRQIPINIRLAFRHAKAGEEKLARAHWAKAIHWGYDEDEETKHNFEMAVLAGLRDKNLVPPIMIRRKSRPQ